MRKLAAGIVHENVERAELVPDIVDEAVDPIWIPYGQRGAEGADTHAFQKRNRRGKFFFVAPAYGDVRAQSRQKTGDRLAETASAAGNDDRFPRKKIGAINRGQCFQFFIGKSEVSLLDFHVRLPRMFSVTRPFRFLRLVWVLRSRFR